MLYLFMFLLFSYGGIYSLARKRESFTKGCVFGIFILMIFLYIFAIMNMLSFGKNIIFLFVILLYVYSINTFMHMSNAELNLVLHKNISEVVKYLLVYILIILICNKLAVFDIDELRLWAAYAKMLFYEDALPQLNGLYSSHYPPMIPLIQYLMLSLGNSFNEGVLFITYYFLVASMILELFGKIKSKRLDVISLEIIFVLVFPCLFYSFGPFDLIGPYFTLYADLLLGALFGYGIYFVYTCNGTARDLISIIIIVFIVTLIKPSAYTFSLILAGLYGLRNLLFLIKGDRRTCIFQFILRLLPFFAIIVAYFSWFYTQGNHYVEEMFVNSVQTAKSVDFDLLLRMVNALFTSPHISRIVPAIPFISFCYFIIVYPLEGSDRKNSIIYCVQLSVFFIIYVFYFFIAYLFVFSAEEARQLSSFVRYINSYLYGIGYFALYIITSYFVNIKDINETRRKIVSILLVLFITISYIFIPFDYLVVETQRRYVTKNESGLQYDYPFYEPYIELGGDYVNIITSSVNDKHSMVYFYIPYSDMNMWTRDFVYYKLIDYGIYLKDYPNYIGKISTDSEYVGNIIIASLRKSDYLFIAEEVYEPLEDLLLKLFGVRIKANVLYKVFNKVDGTLSLDNID